MKRIAILFLGLLVALSVLLIGCSEDSEEIGTPPSLPPMASLSADLGNFPQYETHRGDKVENKDNFIFAATNVGFWQNTLTYGFLIPAAAFPAADDHDFAYSSSLKKWQSTYSVSVNQEVFSATLMAKRNDETILWELYLSSEGEFEDFLWVTGESLIDNSEGEWIIYGSPAQPRQVLQVQWDRDQESYINSKYTIIDEESTKNGSSVEFGLSLDSDYTYYYNVMVIDSEGENYKASILYNQNSTEGSVKSETVYGDSDFRCWDAAHDNVECVKQVS
ncbi:MAG: hypothetical protein RIC35_06630 [Marinoscillum sp.]